MLLIREMNKLFILLFVIQLHIILKIMFNLYKYVNELMFYFSTFIEILCIVVAFIILVGNKKNDN